MVRAESAQGQPNAALDARAALTRVLGVDGSVLRADTPLATLGWDSLAQICWADAMAEAGWLCAAHADAVTVGDLAQRCRASGVLP